MTHTVDKMLQVVLISSVSMALVSGPTWAQTAAGDAIESQADPNFEAGWVKLDELIEMAERQNPDIREAHALWQVDEKKIPQSWALPDPMVGMDVMGEMTETAVGPEENRIMVSQQVPFPLKLVEKRNLAKETSEAAKQNYLAVRRDVLNDLRQTFYSLYEVDASLEVIDEIHELLKKFEAVAQARYSNRQGTQRDVAKSQAEVSMTLEQVYMLEQKRETLAALINSILDRSPLLGLGPASRPDLPSLEKTLPELITYALQNRQEIKEMEAMVQKSRHNKNLAKLNWVPDVDVGFTYTWVGGGTSMSPDDGKDSWMFPLRVNVPLWQNRLIPALQEAQKEIEAAKAKLLGTQNETFYEVKDAFVRYTTATKIAILYDTAVIPQAKLALASDQAGYEAGETDFLNVLDSERVYLNAKLTHVKVYAEALRSYSDLVRATGLEMAEV